MRTQTSLVLMQVAVLLLFFVEVIFTASLWGTFHSYPRIPFLNWLVDTPIYFQWIGYCFFIIASSCFILNFFVRKKREFLLRCGWAFLGIGLIWLISFDQHRFQTWAWQIILYSFCLASMNREQAMRSMRSVTVSIYFYSAVSKIDASFVNSYGQTILDGLLQAIRLSPIWSEATRSALVIGFPLFELLVAILLLVPRTQKLGWIASLLMHLGLLLAVGPWGLNHHLPVLIWNLFFIVQNTILFLPTIVDQKKMTEQKKRTSVEKQLQSKRKLPEFVILFILLFPATGWIGVCDAWTSWELYSARPARIIFSIDASAIDKIPQELDHLLGAESFEHSWRKFDLHRWSFEETNAPSYPEDRFHFAVAVAIIERYGLHDDFQIIHLSTANRFTGKRKKIELENELAVKEFSKRFFLNTKAQHSKR